MYANNGYFANGFNVNGIHKDTKKNVCPNGYDFDGYKNGYNILGYNRLGNTRDGFNYQGYHVSGSFFNPITGLNILGRNKDNIKVLARSGWTGIGINIETRTKFDIDGFNIFGFDEEGYNSVGVNSLLFSRSGYNPWGFDINGYNKSGFNKYGVHKNGTPFDSHNKDYCGNEPSKTKRPYLEAIMNGVPSTPTIEAIENWCASRLDLVAAFDDTADYKHYYKKKVSKSQGSPSSGPEQDPTVPPGFLSKSGSARRDSTVSAGAEV